MQIWASLLRFLGRTTCLNQGSEVDEVVQGSPSKRLRKQEDRGKGNRGMKGQAFGKKEKCAYASLPAVCLIAPVTAGSELESTSNRSEMSDSLTGMMVELDEPLGNFSHKHNDISVRARVRSISTWGIVRPGATSTSKDS